MIINKKFILSQLFIKLNEESPIIGKLVLIGGRIILHMKLILSTRWLQYRYRFKYGKLDLNKIYYVSPKIFHFYIKNKVFFKWENSMRLLEGDWDYTKKPYKDLISFQMINDVFKEGKKWHETKLYYYLPDKKKEREKYWTFKNKEERDKFFSLTEQLYNSIKHNGYKSQQELYSFINRLTQKKWSPVFDEITAAIDRDGQFLFINGKHRLSITKVLDIPKIPVVVLIRHTKWLEFRKELINYSKKLPQKKLNFCFTHPDLQDIPSRYDSSCIQIINQNLSFNQGTFLNLNPNLGIYCHKFEDIGFKCCAVANGQSSDYLLRKIKKIENKEFKIVSKETLINSIFGDHSFDFALNLELPYEIDQNENFNDFMKIIKKVKIIELFVGFSGFSGITGSGGTLKQEYILEFIKENSYFNVIKFVGKSNSHIRIYKLSA